MFKRLQKVKRIVAQYPKSSERESEDQKEFNKYLEGLSDEELQAVYDKYLEEYCSSPEGIAMEKRLAGMSIEQLTKEMHEMLKAS
jgi:hypothetical protein